jgi:hypothetical protein
MCVHEISSAAIAEAMSVIYDTTDLDPASMLAVRLVNTLYMETLIALQEMQTAWEDDETVNPESNCWEGMLIMSCGRRSFPCGTRRWLLA